MQTDDTQETSQEMEAAAEAEQAERPASDADAAQGDQAGAESSETRSLPPTSDERVLAAEQEALRARAEMENFRKRMTRDSAQQLKYASLPLIRDLLEVVDNLQRAINAAPGDDPHTKSLREGVAMVSQQLGDVLAKHGCQPVEALGLPFDPNFHEAISQLPSEEYPAGSVMNEVAVGYTLHDRVVRPSHVVVSKGAE